MGIRIQAELARPHLNIRMEGYKVVASASFSRDTDIANYTADASPANQHARAFLPHNIHFGEEPIVIVEVTQLFGVTRGVLL
jgi:hypothetical protein